MVKLPTERSVKKDVEKWRKIITSPYFRRQFLEAPHKGFFSKWIRDTMNLVRLPLPLPDLKTPFRRAGGLDKES